MTNTKPYDDDDIARLAHILADDLKDQFSTGFEAIEFIKDQLVKFSTLDSKVDMLSNDMVAVKAALKATNDDLKIIRHDVSWLKTVAHSH